MIVGPSRGFCDRSRTPGRTILQTSESQGRSLFRKPKTSSESRAVYYQAQIEMLKEIQAKDWEAVSPEEQARIEAICERAREFADAVEVFVGV